MYSFITTNSAGATLRSGSGLNIKYVLTITESKYVNESGDECKSLQVEKEPKDDKDVVNKKALEDRVEQIKFHLDKEFKSLSVLFKAYLTKIVADTKDEITKEYNDKIKKLDENNDLDIKKLKTEYDDKIKKVEDLATTVKYNHSLRLSNIENIQIKDLKNEIQIIDDFTKKVNKNLDKVEKEYKANFDNLYSHLIDKNHRKVYLDLQKFKPKIWLSALYPYGFENQRYLDHWQYSNLGTSTEKLKIYGYPKLKLDKDNHVGFYFNAASRIILPNNSSDYTLIILCRKEDAYDKGRLITGDHGNAVIGFWKNFTYVLWLNENVFIGEVATDNMYTFVLTKKDDKIKFLVNLTWREKTVDTSTFYKIQNIILGRPFIVPNETISGYIYEFILFDKSLEIFKINLVLGMLKLSYKK